MLSPFTEFKNLLLGFSEAELQKKGEVRQLLYTYATDLETSLSAYEKPTYSTELMDAIEVKKIQIETENDKEFANVEVAMNVFVLNQEYRPIKQAVYPIEWAFGYIFSLFILTILATHYLSLNMNFLVYFIVIEWIMLLVVLYNIAAGRKFLWVYTSKDSFSRKELYLWLQKNNPLFIDLELVREHKENLKASSEDVKDIESISP